ncbi:hypothetical protein HDU76_007200, partial [Blyttiomyces sp. JEL0837]
MDLIKIQETLARLEFEKKAARAAKAALKETPRVDKSKVTSTSTRGTTPKKVSTKNNDRTSLEPAGKSEPTPLQDSTAPVVDDTVIHGAKVPVELSKKQRNKLKRRIKEAAEIEAARLAELAPDVTRDMAEQVGVVENEKTGQVDGVEVVETSEVKYVAEMKVTEGRVVLNVDNDRISCVDVEKRDDIGISESFEAVDTIMNNEVVSPGSDMVPEVIDENAVQPAVVDDINLAGDHLVMEPAAQNQKEESVEQRAEFEQNGPTVAEYERTPTETTFTTKTNDIDAVDAIEVEDMQKLTLQGAQQTKEEGEAQEQAVLLENLEVPGVTDDQVQAADGEVESTIPHTFLRLSKSMEDLFLVAARQIEDEDRDMSSFTTTTNALTALGDHSLEVAADNDSTGVVNIETPILKTSTTSTTSAADSDSVITTSGDSNSYSQGDVGASSKASETGTAVTQ